MQRYLLTLSAFRYFTSVNGFINLSVICIFSSGHYKHFHQTLFASVWDKISFGPSIISIYILFPVASIRRLRRGISVTLPCLKRQIVYF